MTASLNIVEVLDKAARHIEKHGWIQDEFYDPDSPNDPDECAVCVRGGIAVAAGHHPAFAEEPLEYHEGPVRWDNDTSDWELSSEEQADLDLISAVEAAFARHLRKRALVPADVAEVERHAADLVATWNDGHAGSAEQVVTELRACAASLREGGEVS